MAQILILPTRHDRDWARFEERERLALRKIGVDSAAIDYALRDFRMIFDDLRGLEFQLTVPKHCQATADQLRAHYDDLLDRLARAMLLRIAEFFVCHGPLPGRL